jgi:3-oxoacyl-[acyl-carrier-protein] synthase II
MLAGGSEACVSELAIAGFSRMKALTKSSNAAEASRPFDRSRDGFVIAEGAAVLVLEELSYARARGAPIVAELVGYGLSGDGFHISSPPPDGDGAVRSMRSALRDAGLQAEEIGYINAHGTSTPLGDAIEAAAIFSVFGSSSSSGANNLPWVSSTKGATGHLLGASGAIEAAFTALSVRDATIPSTLGLSVASEDCPLGRHGRLVIGGRAMSSPGLDLALSNSFGFGGTNSSLIFKKIATV